MNFDYASAVKAMAAITAIEEPTEEQQEHFEVLADMFMVSWLQEGRVMPKSQTQLDELMTEAMSITSFYTK